MISRESDILHKLYLTEFQKASVITRVGELYQAIAKNSEKAIISALANTIISCYVLGRRLGIGFERIDEEINAQLHCFIKNEDELEKCFCDYSEYQRYIRTKR